MPTTAGSERTTSRAQRVGCLAVIAAALLARPVGTFLSGREAESLLEEGRALAAAGDLAGAGALLERASERCSAERRPAILHERAAVQALRGDAAGALASVRAALRLDPGFRPPPEVEAGLARALPALGAVRLSARHEQAGPDAAVQGWAGVRPRRRDASCDPAREVWALVVPGRRASRAAGPTEARVEVELLAVRALATLAYELLDAAPRATEVHADVLVRPSPDAPSRLLYLGRYARPLTSLAGVAPRFTPAPLVEAPEAHASRDAALIADLDLDPLAYHWLYSRAHRPADAQLRALVARLESVGSRELWDLLRWDGLLVKDAARQAEYEHLCFDPGAARDVPDAVVAAIARRYEAGTLGGLTDPDGTQIGVGFRDVARARGLEVRR